MRVCRGISGSGGRGGGGCRLCSDCWLGYRFLSLRPGRTCPLGDSGCHLYAFLFIVLGAPGPLLVLFVFQGETATKCRCRILRFVAILNRFSGGSLRGSGHRLLRVIGFVDAGIGRLVYVGWEVKCVVHRLCLNILRLLVRLIVDGEGRGRLAFQGVGGGGRVLSARCS